MSMADDMKNAKMERYRESIQRAKELGIPLQEYALLAIEDTLDDMEQWLEFISHMMMKEV